MRHLKPLPADESAFENDDNAAIQTLNARIARSERQFRLLWSIIVVLSIGLLATTAGLIASAISSDKTDRRLDQLERNSNTVIDCLDKEGLVQRLPMTDTALCMTIQP